MRGLVVGLGSIGRRHLANLRTLLPDADLWALRRTGADAPVPAVKVVSTLEAALEARPQFAILAPPSPIDVAESAVLAEAGCTY